MAKFVFCLFYLTILPPFNQALKLSTVKRSTSKQLSYSINEESEIGTFIGNLKLDVERKYFLPYNHLDEFELYDDNEEKYFRVEKDNGKLFVSARIDREQICTRPNAAPNNRLLVDQTLSAPSLSQNNDKECVLYLAILIGSEYWVNVLITVHDINDHQPYFPTHVTANAQCDYIVNVSESVPIGYGIPLLGAKDPDLGLNGVQTYSLRGEEFDLNRFTISYKKPFSLNLMILDELDAEQKTLYTGKLVACDAGQPIPKCGNQSLCIQVTDLNDNRPKFNQSIYEVELKETIMPQTMVIQLQARDTDSGKNGQVRYRFGEPISKAVLEHFSLNTLTGMIKTKIFLNAKEHTRFVLPIVAEDGGIIPLISQTVVHVMIHDVNDHSPWIKTRSVRSQQNTEQPNVLVIEENQPAGTQVGLIITGDDDLGKNSQVECSLRDSSQSFLVEHVNSANSGREIYRLIANQTFDREKYVDGFVYVNILCADKGEIRRTTTERITVKVLDVNEFNPTFTNDQLSVTVKIEEGLPVGTHIMKAMGTDLDAEQSISYHLSREAQSYFHIASATGIVTSRVELDRESTPSIRFNIYVTDNQSITNDMQNSIMNATVIVTDINDNSPELINKELFTIVENRPSFSDLVGQVTAIDKDAGSNGTVRFRILSVLGQNNELIENDTFMINEQSGKIFASQSLDRETCAKYRLVVLMFDLGTPCSRNMTEQIIIEVLDENDNRPIWNNLLPLISSVSYTAENDFYRHSFRLRSTKHVHELGILNITGPIYHGQRVCKFTANDYDTQLNANLSFNIIDNYVTSMDLISSTQIPLITTQYFDMIDGEMVISQSVPFLTIPAAGILIELYLRVTDNGRPELENYGRLFIHLSLLDDSGSLNVDGQGFLSIVQSTGKFGVILATVLVFIMCLTSICLVVAFISIRPPRSNRICCGCCGFATNQNKSNHADEGLTQLTFHPHLVLDDNMRFSEFTDRENALGTMYKTTKLNSVIPDDESLYKWQSGITTSSEFGQSPMYNLTVLGSHNTYDQQHMIHDNGLTTSGGSGISLIPCDRNYSSNSVAPILVNQHFSAMSPMRAHVHKSTEPNESKENTGSESCQTMRTERSDNTLTKVTHARNKEVDGGSADSGQGASEDEPGLMDAWKFHSKTMAEDTPVSSTLMRGHITKHHPSNSLRNAVGNKSHQNHTTMRTFSNRLQSLDCVDSINFQIAPPPKWDTAPTSRWRRPILDNGGNDLVVEEFGNSNPKFEDCRFNPYEQHPCTN